MALRVHAVAAEMIHSLVIVLDVFYMHFMNCPYDLLTKPPEYDDYQPDWNCEVRPIMELTWRAWMALHRPYSRRVGYTAYDAVSYILFRKTAGDHTKVTTAMIRDIFLKITPRDFAQQQAEKDAVHIDFIRSLGQRAGHIIRQKPTTPEEFRRRSEEVEATLSRLDSVIAGKTTTNDDDMAR